VAFLYEDLADWNEITFVIGLLLNIPCMLMLPLLLAEWLLLLALLPFVLLARGLGMRWVVTARGRREDGVRVRYEALAERWAAGELSQTVAAEIRMRGAPSSLGAPVTVRGEADTQTDKLRDRLREGSEVQLDAFVQGYGWAESRNDWIEGRITAIPGWLSFQPQMGLESASWFLPGGDDVRLELVGVAERAVVGPRVVASYCTADGPFRIAVEPRLGPLLPDVIAAGVGPVRPGEAKSWTLWRRSETGGVREVARFTTRPDAEALAANLHARASRQQFWVTSHGWLVLPGATTTITEPLDGKR
jgi:hypothetical protein